MRLVVYSAQPRHSDMGVKLGGRQGGMPEQLLHDAKIRAALE